MSLKAIILQEINLYFEGKAEDLVTKFPELQPAYDAGIKNSQYLQWIQKRRGGEPVEDIIGVVQSFDAAKQRLKAKKMSPDIYAYKTPATLRQALEDLGGSKGQERRRLKDEETTYLGEFGNWVVVMPHTRESSCQLGKGTTWCTAATQSQNLFLSYVARKRNNIVLYYVIKKGADPKQDPTSKLSVGLAGWEPIFSGDDGGVTVDAANNGITYERYKEILGDQALPALRAMEAHAASIGGKHPAKNQMEKIAKDLVDFEKSVANMGQDEKLDFIRNVAEYDPSPEVARKIASYMKEQEMNESLFDLRTTYNEGNIMKLTRTELMKLIEEELKESFDNYPGARVGSGGRSGHIHPASHSKPVEPRKHPKCPSDWEGCMNKNLWCHAKTGEYVGNAKTNLDYTGRPMGSHMTSFWGDNTPCYKLMPKNEAYLEQIIREEYQAVLAEKKKKKSAKDKMKCNSPRRIRKGEAGHGKKKFVVKACDGGKERIIRYGDAGLKIKRKQKGRRKNFRARHNCKNPGSKLKARYWSCRNW